MVVNKVFEDPRGLNFVFCYIDTTYPLDTTILANYNTAKPSRIYNAANGWNPGVSNSNKGVIGFNYLGTGYTFGDTFLLSNSTGYFPVSAYSTPTYGALNFTAYADQFNNVYGNSLSITGQYLNVGTGNFTIELFFNPKSAASSYYQTLFSSESINITLREGYISYFPETPFTDINIQDNNWYYLIIMRKSNRVYCWVNGLLSTIDR